MAVISLVGAWLWEMHARRVADKAVGALKSQWDRFRWKEAAEKYRDKVRNSHGTMQIMGMAEGVPLEDIFIDAYLLDSPTAFGRFGIEHLMQMSADSDVPPPQAERIHGLRLVSEKAQIPIVEKGRRRIVEKDRNLFILGKPGAGKSTFLQYIAIKAAEQTIDKVPIFVSLKAWADSGSELMPFITERFNICDFPDAQPFVEQLLKSGSAMVLFDGLDEVNQKNGQRDRQTRAMKDFIEKYHRTQCLITCRIAANVYFFQSFTYAEIADFTKEQIEIFVRKWFRNKEGVKDEAASNKFLGAFKKNENKRLREIARTPLLLTLLCLAFNKTFTIPPRRAALYRDGLDALLKEWDARRRIERDEIYRKLDSVHKENMLARIAAETFEKNEYFIPQEKLEKLIIDYVENIPPHEAGESTDGETILKAIEVQHGLFVERARKIYSFSHLTFQEYFTAQYIVAYAERGTVTKLVNCHCGDRRWREVFELTASLLPDGTEFMKTFRSRLDELLGDDEKLRSLLIWASEKAASINATPWMVRLHYVFIDLYYPSLTRSSARPRTLDYSRARERAHIRAQASASGLELDLDLGRALGRALDDDPERAHGRVETFNAHHMRAHHRADELGLHNLATELAAFSVPTDSTTNAEWSELATKLRALMMKHRDIGHEWELTEQQEAQLADYLDATDLLRDCFKVAFISPDEMKAILDSLYLPLTQVEDVQNA
jgi:predicted NACHT family NTPase